MFNYNAYNLGISSALPLPELQAAAEVVADLSIGFGQIEWSPFQVEPQDDFCVNASPDEVNFYWERLGKFRVRSGAEIVIDPRPGVEERLLRLPLLGTVLAVLLHQRGHLVLHASAVAINGEALIFAGNKGRGKSTMAATLYGRGHQLIADDVVAITFSPEGLPLVIPGFPHFKLYEDAAISSLGPGHGPFPELADGYEKCGKRVTDRFAQEPLPLKRIYQLGGGPVTRLKLLAPQDALLTLIANSYVARFGRDLLNGPHASNHLQQCTKLIAEVPVFRLERPGALTLLPAIAQLVEQHLDDVSPAAACA